MNDLKSKIRKALEAYSRGSVSAEHACMAVALALSEDEPKPITFAAPEIDDAAAKRIADAVERAAARAKLPPQVNDALDVIEATIRNKGK